MEDLISKEAARILDLLEQIQSVNQMIEVHEEDNFMQDQYKYRKEQFVKELVLLLGENYKIELGDLAA